MLWFIIGILCLAVDQLSKLYVANHFVTGHSVPVIENVFHLTYHENDGAAFSMLSGKIEFLTIASIIIVLGISVYIYIKRPTHNLEIMSFTLIISGAIGNLIDRIARGAVVDFLDFTLINFPVFNFADCFVCIGGVLFFIYVMKYVDNGTNKGEESEG